VGWDGDDVIVVERLLLLGRLNDHLAEIYLLVPSVEEEAARIVS
jgi:hypothetical protein